MRTRNHIRSSLATIVLLLALQWICTAGAQTVTLENPHVALNVDTTLGAITSIHDKELGITYEINGISFVLDTGRGKVQALAPTSNTLVGDTLTFSFETSDFDISLHYQLGADNRFVEKWFELTTKDGQPCEIGTVTLEDGTLGPQFEQIHFHDDNTIWQCPINLFLRGENGGCFAGISYPYWQMNLDGNTGFTLGFAPNYQLPAATTFVSEKYFLGVYRKEGIYRYSQGPYPGAVPSPYVSFSGTGLSQHFKNGVIPAAAVNSEVLDWGEVWAMQEFMRHVLPDDLLLPEDGFWVWQNGWWAGLSSPNTAILDQLKQAGVHDIMTAPIWHGRGNHPYSPAYLTQMRVEPMGFPKDNAAGQYTADFIAPPAWDAFHQYGEDIGVHVSSFSLPGLLFNDKPEWASIEASGNVSEYLFGQKVSCPAVKDYMNHMLNVLDNVFTNYQPRWWGFDGRWLSYWEVPYYRPGPEGLGFDTCHATDHGHLPGDNLYMEWENIQELLRELRTRHPNVCLEQYLGLKRGGPWAMRYLNADDNYYETNGAVMNRFQTWHNQNDRFRPVYKNYAAIFGGSPAAFRVNVLSSISTTSYCQIGRGYPDLALQENRDFLAQWRAWATTNHAYLKVKRDLFDCPGFKRIDGSAHISGNRGFLFLFPSGSGLTPRALVPMNRWIGLDEDPAALYRITEVYPQPGRLIGTYRYGDEFPFDMPAASPVVLSIDPAPAGAQPEQTVPLLDAAQVVSVAAFSSTNPGTATQWTNYPYHLSSMATATWNESSGEMGISQSSAGGSGLFRTGSSRLPTDPVTMRVKQLNRTGGGWGIVGLMISAARQPGYFTTADDTYTLAVAALGGTSVRCEVRRTYLDGTGNYQLYVGPAFDLATSGPVRLDIVRNEAGNYEFLANGNLLYTSGGAAGDFYDAAAKDSLVYHQIVQAGDGAMTATVDNFGIDSTPPGLSTLSPANVATGVATAADLTAMFGEPVRKGTGNITLRKSADQSLVETFDVASSARITFSGTTLTIDPTSVLAGLTGYYVQIDPTAVKDLAGNSFAGITDTTTTAWSFTTGPPDTAEPALATLIPANGSSAAVINANLTATFNEPVQKGAGSITLRKSADNSLVETFDVASSPSITVSGATLTIDPASALETFTGHYVQIDAGAIRDLSGNSFAGISGATTWSFTTAGDAWTPAELPNKALWLDAADAASVVLSGSTVSQWNDKSGNGRNVAQANATYKPNYATASLNGNPAITFDGSDDYLMGNVPDSVFPVNITLVHVFVPLSTASTKGMLQIASALGSTSPWLLQQQSSPTQFKHYVNGNYQITETIATSSPCISVLTYSGSQWISWLNGTQGAASTGARGSYPGTSLYLGNGYNGYWNGRFGEVIATTSSLATEDRQKLEGYLAWKWGLQTNLPADHPYKNAAPAITGTATPVITTLNPANNATGVAVGDNLVTTFDRNIQKGTGNITLRKSADDSVVETFDLASSPRVTVSGTQLTIDPTNDLADATGYYVQIDTTAIKDSADNFFAGIADTTTWNFTTAVAPAPTPCAGLVLGDSTIAGYAPYTAVADFIYTPQQTSAGWQVTSIAVPGHTIYNQKTTYLATPGRTTVDYTIAQIGLNDMNPGEAASVAIARLQDLVNTINANKKPGSLTIISTMLPCKQRWMDGYGTVNGPIAQQKFLDMNEAIKGNGPNPISGVDYRVSAHTLLLDDGAGNLNPIYDTGDHIHENNAGRQVIASAWRDALVALGLLTSVADTTPPTTSTLSPADGAGGVAAGASLAVTFNEAIAIGTGDITIKNLTDNAQSTITITDGSQVSVAGSVLTINPTADLAGGKSYAIRIDATAIKDSSGNFFAGIADDTTWNFATDGTPPTVVTLSPADDATDGSPFGNLSAIFDENIQKGSGNITLKKSADDSVVETFDVATSPRVTVSGTQLTIDPTSILTGLTGYYVQIDAGAIKDLAGNPFPGISGSGTWSFTTAASSATAVITTADGNGADAYVHKGANGNNNYGGGTNLWAQDFSGTSSVAVYIRFDLSGYVSGSFTSATLSLTSNEQATVPLGSAAGRDFRIHGLLDGQAGNNWGEGTITYNNAPGLTIGSGVASADIDPAKTVLLANTLVQVGNGLMVDLSNPALLSFLNNDTDGLVTFIVSGPVTGASVAFDWAAKEHATLAAPTLNVQVGGSSITFTDWQTANSTTGDSDDDHDGDGVMNGIEYFLGGANATTGFTPLPGVSDDSGTLSVTWVKSADYPGTYGTDFRVETSGSLTGTWTQESPGANLTITGNDVKYTFPAPLGARKFARLVVTGP